MSILRRTDSRPSRFSQFTPKARTSPFGAGIETRPASWVAIARRREDEAFDKLVDELAAEREAQDRYERGLDF